MSQTIDLKQTAELLSEKDRFALICHASPDGDTLGGAFALCHALQKLQKSSKVITPEAPSKRFDYLKNGLEIQDFEEEFIISVDVADAALFGDMENEYKDKIDLCIDHHVSNTGYAGKLLLDKNAAAACEVVLELIKELSRLHKTELMNTDIAACLYTGISTDTGCFRFANTNADSHRRTAELMEYNFDCAGLNYLLFEMRTVHRIELEKKAFESTEYAFGGKCAMIILTKEMLSGADEEDINAISSLPRQIQGVELGVTFKEKEANIWKISLRSNNYIDSRQICSNLGGGGHKRAAGCRLKGSFDECKQKLLNEIEQFI